MATPSFKDKIFADYPIPMAMSIWGGNGVDTYPLADWGTFFISCVQELQSDVYITDYTTTSGRATVLPDDTIAVVGAKMNFPFQGNRTVKVTFDKPSCTAYLWYTPATITYRRRVNETTIDLLQGDMYIYVKHYFLYKMADKELAMLGMITLDADNGQINLGALEKFRDEHYDRYNEMKDEILIYTVGN